MSVKISQLPIGGAVTGIEKIPAVQGGGTVSITPGQLVALVPPVSRSQVGAALYPLTAGESSAGVTPVDYAYPAGNILRYGGDPTAGAMSDTAMTSAVAALGARGGIIRFPQGSYKFSVNWDWTQRRSIILQGEGSMAAGSPPGTTFYFTQTGAGVLLNAPGSNGCGLRNIQIIPDPAFTGWMILLGISGGVDASFFSMVDCTLGTTVGSGCIHVALDKSDECFFERCNFLGGNPSITGQQAVGGSYSNVMKFSCCAWSACHQNPIAWGGESWTFDNCNFEQLANGTAGAFGSIPTTPCNGLSFRGCWFGDVTSTSPCTWITFFGNGLVVDANRFGGSTVGTYALSLNSCSGVSIRGNYFNGFYGAVSFDTATISAVSIEDNSFFLVTNPISGNYAPYDLVFNPNSPRIVPPAGMNLALFGPNGYETTRNGMVHQWGSATVTTGTPLPLTWPRGSFFVVNMIVGINSPADGSNTAFTTNITGSGFTLNVKGVAGTNRVDWHAIGTS